MTLLRVVAIILHPAFRSTALHLDEKEQDILCADLGRQRPVDVPVGAGDGIGPGLGRPPDLEPDRSDSVVG
jgi:hypothetical protein